MSKRGVQYSPPSRVNVGLPCSITNRPTSAKSRGVPSNSNGSVPVAGTLGLDSDSAIHLPIQYAAAFDERNDWPSSRAESITFWVASSYAASGNVTHSDDRNASRATVRHVSSPVISYR